ncbi:MAG: beta-propeller domain-containing protein [Pirellulales bacterium]|nr:beta-propeller domain-containing protein [Pirellulales bacterium]
MSASPIANAVAPSIVAGLPQEISSVSLALSNPSDKTDILHAATSEGFERFSSLAEIQERLINEAVERYKFLFGKDYVFPIENNPGMIWHNGNLGYSPNPQITVLGTTNSSNTNTQVAGVDEADLMETDGNYLYMLSRGELVIVDVRSVDRPSIAARLKVNQKASSMYLSGDRLTLISGRYEQTGVSVLDVSDRASPEIVQTTRFDGCLIDSRAIGDRVYLVIDHGIYLPEINIVNADGSSIDYNNLKVGTEGQYRYETEAEYRHRMEGYLDRKALPAYTTYDAEGKELAHGFVCDPRDFYKPGESDGLHRFSVMAVIDMKSNTPGPAAAIVIPGGSVGPIYASTDAFYLLGNTTAADSLGSYDYTAIRKVSISGQAEKPVFVAKGVVAGRILDQFSLDEHDGLLRVATTRGSATGNWNGMQNDLFVLEQRGTNLKIIGSLEGLAQGERIYSVRFLDEHAFVVTFRNTDPLFAVDLSDPTAPQVKGELILPGFSNYLHSIEGGLLLGLGRHADSESGLFADPQVSLFDVNDLGAPKLLDRLTIPTGRSGGLNLFDDHHVVAYYPESRVLTVSVPGEEGNSSTLNDLYVFRVVAGEGMAELKLLGKVEHRDSVLRSVQIENRLISISTESIEVHNLTNPEEVFAKLTVNEPAPNLPPEIPGSVIGGVWLPVIRTPLWPILAQPLPIRLVPITDLLPPIVTPLSDAAPTKHTDAAVHDAIYGTQHAAAPEDWISTSASVRLDSFIPRAESPAFPTDLICRFEAASKTMLDDSVRSVLIAPRQVPLERRFMEIIFSSENIDSLSAQFHVPENITTDIFSALMELPVLETLDVVKDEG